jgi:tRNA-Thr(GGU) m(6)t(6)A37 methyltransferase TsaA
MESNLIFDSIATIHSPYKEKFAVPRQPGLVPSAIAELEILPPYDDINAFLGLQEFSHLWLVFIFHKNRHQEKWSPTVRPPRLGGNKRLGVFATRSPCRPNPVGLSLVEFHGIKQVNGKIFLMLSNIDLVEGTPVIDIKPYIPYADSKPEALAGFAQQQPESLMRVEFSAQAKKSINLFKDDYLELQQLIIEVLQQDPRPAYKKKKEDPKIYAVHLLDFNISWINSGSTTTVLDVELRV